MIQCDEVRELLLEADLGQAPAKALDAHLSTCSRCSILRLQLEASEAQMRAALDELASRVAPYADPSAARETPIQHPPRVAWRWKTLLPLAAAVVAGLAIFRTPPGAESLRVEGDELLPTSLQAAHPVVRGDGHEWIAVLPTEDPDITVIWFSPN